MGRDKAERWSCVPPMDAEVTGPVCVPRLTDEELVQACGGRTAHK